MTAATREGFFTNLPTVVRVPQTPRCGACKLHQRCKSPKMKVTGEGRRKILIIAEAPGATEDETGVQLVGKAGKRMRNALEKAGVDLDRDCWKTNALICRPWYFDEDGKKKNRTPTDQEIDYCRPNLMKTVRELKPEVIITAGGEALKSLIAGNVWRDTVGPVSRWVGWQIPCQHYNAWVCPTYHPSFIERMEDQPLFGMFFEKHLKSAAEIEGRPWKQVPDYKKQITVEYDPTKASAIIRQMIDDGRTVALDFETRTLKPDGEKSGIISCAVSNGKTTVAYPWHGEAIKATKRLALSDLPKIASNLKFEERYARAEFGHGMNNWWLDTMIASHVLDNRASEDKRGKGTTSIKFQAFVELGFGTYDDHVKPYMEGDGGNGLNRLSEVSLSDLLLYNGLDALLEYKVAMIQSKRLGLSL